jgi:hypothetical protein
MTAIINDFATIRGASEAQSTATNDGPDAAILALFREWRDHLNRAIEVDSDEELDHCNRIEDEIAAIPAQTVEGLAIKVYLATNADGIFINLNGMPLFRSLREEAMRLAPGAKELEAAGWERRRSA